MSTTVSARWRDMLPGVLDGCSPTDVETCTALFAWFADGLELSTEGQR